MLGVALVISAGVSVSIEAQKPPKATNIPVNVVILPYDSGVGPLQIQDDGQGDYRNSSTLASVIQPNGDWRLDSYYQTGATRNVFLRFDQPIAGSGPGGGDPIGPPSGQYKVNLTSYCSNYNNPMQSLLPGQTIQCPMGLHFDSGGKTYNVRMNYLTFPETNPTNVTCIFPTSGSTPCSQWRLQPSGSYTYTDVDGVEKAGLRNVARLYYETTVKGKTVQNTVGNFYFAYSIIITKS
jgi:hypothetical protein